MVDECSRVVDECSRVMDECSRVVDEYIAAASVNNLVCVLARLILPSPPNLIHPFIHSFFAVIITTACSCTHSLYHSFH